MHRLAFVLGIDTRDTAVFDDQFFHLHMRKDRQVCTPSGRIEIRHSRAASLALVQRQLEIANALLVSAVIICSFAVPRCYRR